MTFHNQSLFSFKNWELHTTVFWKSELYIVLTMKKIRFSDLSDFHSVWRIFNLLNYVVCTNLGLFWFIGQTFELGRLFNIHKNHIPYLEVCVWFVLCQDLLFCENRLLHSRYTDIQWPLTLYACCIAFARSPAHWSTKQNQTLSGNYWVQSRLYW